MTPAARGGDGGFTLLELMISLGLFALIAVAGLALVDGILAVEGRTEKRLDQVADVQRAMFVVASDLDQVAFGRITGTPQGVSFSRSTPGFGGPPVGVTYGYAGGALTRSGAGVTQQVLAGVSSVRWRYFDGGWLDAWPPDEARAGTWPRAVSVELALAAPSGTGGTLRRVVTLPAPPSYPE